jgi:hypothetical protein
MQGAPRMAVWECSRGVYGLGQALLAAIATGYYRQLLESCWTGFIGLLLPLLLPAVEDSFATC